MATPNQITYAGKTEYSAGNDPTGIITYDLTPDTSGGMPITADVFQKGVAAYMAADKKELLTENVAFRFSKQLLLFLLSFEDCTGLTFCKYLRPEGDESLAIVAVDETNSALGWNKTTKSFGGGGGTFVGAEWAHSGTAAQLKQCIKPDGSIDIEKFFTSF